MLTYSHTPAGESRDADTAMRREDRVAEQLRLGEDIDAARLRQAWRNVVQALLPKVAPSSRRYLRR